MNQFYDKFKKKIFDFNLDNIKKLHNKFHVFVHSITEKCGLKKNRSIKENNFIMDPTKIIQKKHIELEKESFYYDWYKSNHSCSFILNKETFLAWAGYYNDASTRNYPLIIYNLSKKQRVAAINPYDNNNSHHIRVVSTYPKDSSMLSYSFYSRYAKSNIIWLYTGDRNGILKVYEINNNKDTNSLFKELHYIKTGRKQILSALIFQDQFKEINQNTHEKDNCHEKEHQINSTCCVYALISFYNSKNENILMYRFISENSTDKNGKWEQFREINNPANNYCFTINYFHDYTLSKTFILFGFSSHFVKVYNLKDNSWEAQKQFPTTNHVSSINFIIRKTSNENNNDNNSLRKTIGVQISKKTQISMVRYVIYTQHSSNLVIVGDIDNGTSIKQLPIPNATNNFDLCIWNSIPCSSSSNSKINNNDKQMSYLIVLSYDGNNNNALNIINFEDFSGSVISSKAFHNFNYPINIIKTKILKENENSMMISKNEEGKKQKQYKEVIVLFNCNGQESSIYLYEE